MTSFLRTKTLTLKVADEIASHAIRAAERNSFAPIAVCVMDSSGHSIVTKRMDRCPAKIFSAMAEHKAMTCVNMNTSTRAYGDKYLSSTSTPDQFMRLSSQIASSNGQLISFAGGVVLRCADDGNVVGSIGVSGAAGNEDEYCALEGVLQTASIVKHVVTEPSQHSCTTII